MHHPYFHLLQKYIRFLQAEERSSSTIDKYQRDILFFLRSLREPDSITKAAVIAHKEALLRENAMATVNAKLAAVNGFLTFCGLENCRVKPLRLQRKLFRDPSRDLSRDEYHRLLNAAGAQRTPRLALLLETICASGIRVSEVQYITVEAARAGKAEISLKGKIRTILLPSKLSKKLLKYAKKQKIASGEIFLTRRGKGLSRKQIWAEMKALCKQAGVAASKVFPHNLRHLFAKCFFQACHDIARLADVLGHSSVETTRIYLLSSGAEHTKILEQLRLIQ